MAKKKTEKCAWDFVIEHYPNYYRSNEIANNDDLQKLLDDEQEDGDAASKLLEREYNDDVNNPQIQADYNESIMNIYEKAIMGFLNKKKK